jgi:hypothetical protein
MAKLLRAQIFLIVGAIMAAGFLLIAFALYLRMPG